MNTVTIPAATSSTASNTVTAGVEVRPRHPILKTTVVSALLGAVVVAGAAAIAHAAGVPFEIDGEMIPVLGFAQMTLLGAVLGGVLASVLDRRSSHPRRRFLQTTIVLTVGSCLPSATLPPDASTRIALVALHLLAAAIIVPALARKTAR